MNLIIFDERTRLLINRISNLMLIKLHGSPLRKWKPEEYVKIVDTVLQLTIGLELLNLTIQQRRIHFGIICWLKALIAK